MKNKMPAFFAFKKKSPFLFCKIFSHKPGQIYLYVSYPLHRIFKRVYILAVIDLQMKLICICIQFAIKSKAIINTHWRSQTLSQFRLKSKEFSIQGNGKLLIKRFEINRYLQTIADIVIGTTFKIQIWYEFAAWQYRLIYLCICCVHIGSALTESAKHMTHVKPNQLNLFT